MTIGAREIYDRVVAVDNKVDTLVGANLDARLRALERWRYVAGGAALTAGTAIGWLLQMHGGG